MPYIRRISAEDAVDAGYPHYQVVMAASPESMTVLAGFLGDGGHPRLHTHDVDLFFVVLEGSTTLRLGRDSHPAKAGEVIYIPAGLPHGSDNQSGARAPSRDPDTSRTTRDPVSQASPIPR